MAAPALATTGFLFTAGSINELLVLAQRATGANGAAIALENPDGDVVCIAQTGTLGPRVGAVLDRNRGLSGACVRTGRTQVCYDTELDRAVDAVACRQLGLRSTVVVPLIRASVARGILAVYSDHPAAFTDSEVRSLERLSNYITGQHDSTLAFDNPPATLERCSDEPEVADPSRRQAGAVQYPDDQPRSRRVRRGIVRNAAVVLIAATVAIAASIRAPEPVLDKPAIPVVLPPVIAIDPGHGGDDAGTVGRHGLVEKSVALDLARRVGSLLQHDLGATVVLTRPDDRYVPLHLRTDLANRSRAQLFVSIHANSSKTPAARGIETYYLDPEVAEEDLASLREAAGDEHLETAAVENQPTTVEQSREFATRIQEALYSGLRESGKVRDRGTRTAPLAVLRNAKMPAVLVEISFLSNSTEEQRLFSTEYRQRIAESLYEGIRRQLQLQVREPAGQPLRAAAPLRAPSHATLVAAPWLRALAGKLGYSAN